MPCFAKIDTREPFFSIMGFNKFVYLLCNQPIKETQFKDEHTKGY